MEHQLIVWKKPMLSLKEMAMRRVVINLCSGSDILSLIARLCYELNLQQIGIEKTWKYIIEDKVKHNVLQLQLPKKLSKQIFCIVPPISSEIRRWILCHKMYLLPSSNRTDFDVSLFELLVWTTVGTIDYKKTAEKLIRVDKLDVMKRYKLACLYCFDNDVPGLWRELPERSRSDLIGQSWTGCNIELEYWTSVLIGKESEFPSKDFLQRRKDFLQKNISDRHSFHQLALKNSVMKGNKAGTEYFFQKLTNEEREASLIGKVCAFERELFYLTLGTRHGEIFCFLFTKLSPEQQKQILKEHHYEILIMFMDWPWQDLLVDISDFLWSFIPERKYGFLIHDIYSNFEHYSCPFFLNSFQKIFMSSPNSFRKYFAGSKFHCNNMFGLFFDLDDTESIEVVFRNLDADDRMTIVSSNIFCRNFDRLMMRDKRHLVELCVREATLSKEEGDKLKEVFTRFVSRGFAGEREDMELRNRNWERMFELIDEIGANAVNKRSCEEVTLITAKKLCNAEEKNMLSSN